MANSAEASLIQNKKKEFKGQVIINSVIEGPQYVPYFKNANAGSGSTSSGTPVDFPGPIDKVINKQQTDTAILVSGTVGAFKGTNTGIISFYLRFNGAGTDYLIATFFYNDINAHRAVPFTAPIAVGLVPGQYTARLRWSTDSANANSDGNDIIHIKFQEGLFK